MAAGILGCGTVVLGTAEACGSFLTEARARVDAEGDGALVAMVAAIRRDGGKLPGFGHPLHKPVDPRAERILALADARGVAGAALPARAGDGAGGGRGLGQAADR